MSDWSELKRLAEAASFGDWRADQLAVTADTRALVCCGRAHLECCGDPDVDGEEFDPVCTATAEPFASFIAAAQPGVVLALIAENERLRNGVSADMEEIDRIQGEYERQWRKARELRAELAELRDSMAYRTSLIGRLEEESHSTRQMLVDVVEERDRLRTEAEALRSIATELLGWVSCQDVNHRHGEFHESDEPCKVLARINAALRKDQNNG